MIVPILPQLARIINVTTTLSVIVRLDAQERVRNTCGITPGMTYAAQQVNLVALRS